MSCCCVHVVLGHCGMEFTLYRWAWEWRGRWTHHSFGWWWWLSMNFDDGHGCVLWCYFSVTPQWTKTADVMPHLKMPPWHHIGQISIGLILTEYTWKQSRGPFNCRGPFCNLAPFSWWLTGNESRLADSWSKNDILLVYIPSTKNISIPPILVLF